MWRGWTSIAAPTLLIWGDQDAFVPESDQQTLLATIAGSRLETYRGTGHAVHWEEPARFAADLVAFVERLVVDRHRQVSFQPDVNSRISASDHHGCRELVLMMKQFRSLIDHTEREIHRDEDVATIDTRRPVHCEPRARPVRSSS